MQLRGVPDFVDMIAIRDGIDRESAKPVFREWRASLQRAFEVTLKIRARESGLKQRKITLYGSSGVHAAYDNVLDLFEAGGIDTDAMPWPKTWRPHPLVVERRRGRKRPQPELPGIQDRCQVKCSKAVQLKHL